MTVLYGATPNQCESVGGWLPFNVDCESSQSHKISGTLYQPHKSGAFETAEQAKQAAKQIAYENSCGVVIRNVSPVAGCVRCYEGGYSTRHMVVQDDSTVSCGHCGRQLVTVDEVNELKASISRACLAVTKGQVL